MITPEATTRRAKHLIALANVITAKLLHNLDVTDVPSVF